MKMYFITKQEGLIGKEIAYTHMAVFAEAITIVTKDKGVFVVRQYEEGDGSGSIYVYPERKARAYVLKYEWLRDELHKKGLISNEELEEYEKEQRLEFERQKEERRVAKERAEKESYERLKAKFEQE